MLYTSICCSRVSGDKTDGSPAAQFAAFTTPVGLERDVRNVQEVPPSLLSIQIIRNLTLNFPISVPNGRNVWRPDCIGWKRKDREEQEERARDGKSSIWVQLIR